MAVRTRRKPIQNAPVQPGGYQTPSSTISQIHRPDGSAARVLDQPILEWNQNYSGLGSSGFPILGAACATATVGAGIACVAAVLQVGDCAAAALGCAFGLLCCGSNLVGALAAVFAAFAGCFEVIGADCFLEDRTARADLGNAIAWDFLVCVVLAGTFVRLAGREAVVTVPAFLLAGTDFLRTCATFVFFTMVRR